MFPLLSLLAPIQKRQKNAATKKPKKHYDRLNDVFDEVLAEAKVMVQSSLVQLLLLYVETIGLEVFPAPFNACFPEN